MKQMQCDTVVIGAGSAGLAAFRKASENGALCILVDQGPLGTSAQRSGELPLSLLMSAGEALYSASHLENFGIETINSSSFNIDKVLNSLRAVRSRATSEVLSFLYKIPEERRLRGQASFLDAHTIRVEECDVKFKTAIIATGSSPLVTYEQSRLKGILTANEFFDLDTIPSSVAIFGSSLSGLQIGQALSYLGVDVAVFGQRRLWDLSDDNVLTVAHRMLSSRFNLYIDTFITSIEEDGNGYSIYYVDERNFENYLHMESIIAATDRIPNISGLNLQDIGINLHHNGCIKIDEQTMQTSVPNIFAAGEVCHDRQNTSISIAEGQYAGKNAALYPVLEKKPKDVRISIVHTDPCLAIVGLSLKEMRERADKDGKRFIVTDIKLHLGQYRSQREDGGIISMYTDIESHKILGAEICAKCGDHIAQTLAFAISKETTVEELAQFNFYHLTYENILCEAAQEAIDALSSIGNNSPGI